MREAMRQLNEHDESFLRVTCFNHFLLRPKAPSCTDARDRRSPRRALHHSDTAKWSLTHGSSGVRPTTAARSHDGGSIFLCNRGEDLAASGSLRDMKIHPRGDADGSCSRTRRLALGRRAPRPRSPSALCKRHNASAMQIKVAATPIPATLKGLLRRDAHPPITKSAISLRLSVMMIAAIAPATTVSHRGATSSPIFPRWAVIITRGMIANGS